MFVGLCVSVWPEDAPSKVYQMFGPRPNS